MVSATTLLALISYLRGGIPRTSAEPPVAAPAPAPAPSTALLGLADSTPTRDRAP
jgi:hypothetical protein